MTQENEYHNREFLYEVVCSFHCAACSEQIVVEENHVVGCYCVLVYLYRVCSVFLAVAFLNCLSRQFARLAAKHHTGT